MTTTENCVTITPEIAKEWLDRSKGNRHVRRSEVEKLKSDIRMGLWRYNGDRIRFLPDGTLYDGHHRLTACCESGISILSDTFVIPFDAKQTIDKGRSRTTADVLAMEHGLNPRFAGTISAAVRMMIIHDNTNISNWAAGGVGPSNSKWLTEQSMQTYYFENSEKIDRATLWVHENIKRKQDTLISKSQAVVFIVLASRSYDAEDIYNYLYSILTGYGVVMGSTADHIRAALMAAKLGQRKMATANKIYSVIKGFKSIMAGRTIKHPNNAPFRPSNDNIPRFSEES
jgi:hypothetical protein